MNFWRIKKGVYRLVECGLKELSLVMELRESKSSKKTESDKYVRQSLRISKP